MATRMIDERNVQSVEVLCRALLDSCTRSSQLRSAARPRKACSACGDRRRLRRHGGSRFCQECLDHVRRIAFPEYYCELGGGD